MVEVPILSVQALPFTAKVPYKFEIFQIFQTESLHLSGKANCSRLMEELWGTYPAPKV